MPDNKVIGGFMKKNILFGMIIIVIIFTNCASLSSVESSIIGIWEEKDKKTNVVLFEFKKNHDYIVGIKESDIFSEGKWELNNNTITLTSKYNRVDGDYIEDKRIIQFKYTIIDINNIILQRLPDNTIYELRASRNS
jgi:hypothetical protein